MAISLSRLGVKLVASALTFLMIVGLVTGFLVTQGFRQTEQTATEQSIEGFTSESRDKLVLFTQQEAALAALQLHQASMLLTSTGQYIGAMEQRQGAVPSAALNQLARTEGGIYFDADPTRVSDLWIPYDITSDATLERDVRATAALDSLVPGVLKQYSDAVAVYYSGHQGWSRYYPAIGLQDIIPPDFQLSEELFFKQAVAKTNPQHRHIWTPAYVDPAGNGLLTTVSLPLYSDDQLRGVIGMDISLTRIIDRLNTIKITTSGSAFLIDGDGRLVAAAPAALQLIDGLPNRANAPLTATLGLDLTQSPNTELQRAIQLMRSGQSGAERLVVGGQDLFLSYAPVADVGWSLGMLTPVSELTSTATAVSRAIQSGTRDTVRFTMLILSGLFLIATLGLVMLSHQVAKPIVDLRRVVGRVASGDLNQQIAITSRDEIGELQRGVQQMMTSLGEQRAVLEQQNRELQASLVRQQQLNETVQQLSLPLLPVLDRVLALPLIGHIDPLRAQQLTQQLLTSVSQQRASHVIIDVTGLAVVDPQIMRMLLKTTHAIELLGAQVILVGISAHFAQTMAQEGVSLTNIQVHMNLRTAIDSLVRRRLALA